MSLTTNLEITSIYAAILGLMFIVFTFRAGAYRAKNGISFGDGNDAEMTRRMRSQGNFTESVPIALILIALVELAGASAGWVHGLGAALVVGRSSHWLQLSGFVGSLAFRAGGMLLTLGSVLCASVWLLVHSF